MNNRTEPAIIELARKLTGYRSHPNRESAFGRDTGFPGQPWAGSFAHEALRESGLLETSLVSTAPALAWYLQRDRVFQENPQPGDLVFFAFTTTGVFGQPHVGLVSNVDRFKETGEFRAIEGETASGLNRGNQDSDGVFERVRYQPDVLGFVRPREPRPLDLTNVPENVPVLRPSNFSKSSPLRGTATTSVQYALFEVTGFDKFDPGVWDGLTKSAFDQFLRTVGFYDRVTDVPTAEHLEALSLATVGRYFDVP